MSRLSTDCVRGCDTDSPGFRRVGVSSACAATPKSYLDFLPSGSPLATATTPRCSSTGGSGVPHHPPSSFVSSPRFYPSSSVASRKTQSVSKKPLDEATTTSSPRPTSRRRRLQSPFVLPFRRTSVQFDRGEASSSSAIVHMLFDDDDGRSSVVYSQRGKASKVQSNSPKIEIRQKRNKKKKRRKIRKP